MMTVNGAVPHYGATYDTEQVAAMFAPHDSRISYLPVHDGRVAAIRVRADMDPYAPAELQLGPSAVDLAVRAQDEAEDGDAGLPCFVRPSNQSSHFVYRGRWRPVKPLDRTSALLARATEIATVVGVRGDPSIVALLRMVPVDADAERWQREIGRS
jgi:hypothetical protein